MHCVSLGGRPPYRRTQTNPCETLAMNRLIIAVCCLLLGLSLCAQNVSDNQSASELLGVPPTELAQVGYRIINLPALGMTVQVAKAIHAPSGELLYACKDLSGNDVDLSTIRRLEIQARAQDPTMKMEAPLRRALTHAKPNELIRVMLWLHYDAELLDSQAAQVFAENAKNLSVEESRALEQQVTDFAMSHIANVTAPVVEALDSMGVILRYTSSTAPVIAITATPSAIATIAELPAVDTLYLENLRGWDTNSDANATHRTDRVHKLGVKGRGIRVAVLENNGIELSHPYLNVSAWFNAAAPNPDDHVQGTSGCIASQFAPRLGAAPSCQLYSANAASYSDTNLTAAADWIVTQNIDVTNMSFGVDSSPNLAYMDRYMDYQSRTYLDSYVASAGNNGIGGNVGTPGKAWNVLAVGSHTDGENNNWTDDVMSGFSSTSDPSTGCEKPNLAANGQDVDTLGDGSVGGSQTTAWLYDNYSGTSFSSPHTAANLANAMTLDSSLRTSPEAAIAAMMATAWHNIEGTRSLSEQDGAGGLNGFAAVTCAREDRVRFVNLSPTSFNVGGYYTYDIELQGKETTRVCISWGALANSGYTTTILNADLDLAIFEGSGVVSGTGLAYSSSVNNNFEIVEFTPPTTGTYTVRINDFRFDGTSERVGIAWSQMYRDNASFTMQEYTPETSTTAGPTIGRASYYMDIQHSGSPNNLYITAPGSTIGPGYAFSGGTWVPLNFDLWTTLWLDHQVSNAWFWNGFSGTLNSAGESLSNRMSIPDYPPLQGTELNHWCFSFELGAGYRDTVKEISAPHHFEIWTPPVANYETALGDDGSVEHPLPFPFPFFGNSYTSVWINANGNLSFGSGDSDWSESAAEMQSGQPRIAAFWDDVHCGQENALVRVREILYNRQSVVVEYLNVPQRNLSGDDNTARIILKPDGSVEIQLRDCDLQDCIVGISAGGGTGVGPVDLSNYGFALKSGSFFQQFTAADPLDLTTGSTIYFSSLKFLPTSPSAQSYTLVEDINP